MRLSGQQGIAMNTAIACRFFAGLAVSILSMMAVPPSVAGANAHDGCAREEADMCAFDSLHQLAALYGAQAQARMTRQGAVSHAVIVTKDGESVDLGWSTDAPDFVAELEGRRAGLRLIEEIGINDLGGVRRLTMQSPDGGWQVHDIWMDIDNVMRFAVARAAKRERAVLLVARLNDARAHGLFGRNAMLAGPLPAPDKDNAQ